MTELGRATAALTKEIKAYDEQTILLTSEADAALNEHRVAQRLLTEHRGSRRATLDPFYLGMQTAEDAEHKARLTELAEADEQQDLADAQRE